MNMKEIQKALGPLAVPYNDPTIFEIMVDGPDKVKVSKEGKLVNSDVKFASVEELRTLIDGLMALGEIRLGPKTTSGKIRFPDGSRLLAVIPPTALTSPHLIIRKSRTSQFSMDQLIGWGSVSREGYQLLQSAIQARLNILVAGGTGSGKTTFANVLSDEFEDNERVIMVESLYEFRPRNEGFIRLGADNSPDHSFTDLVILASNMRPDRLIIGELTGPEALKVLEIFNTGHDGSMTTIHALNPQDALTRLETMCLMANLGLGISEIRRVIASAIQLITYQERMPDGSRKLTHIVEICGLEDGRYKLKPLMRFNPETNATDPTGAKPCWNPPRTTPG